MILSECCFLKKAERCLLTTVEKSDDLKIKHLQNAKKKALSLVLGLKVFMNLKENFLNTNFKKINIILDNYTN